MSSSQTCVIIQFPHRGPFAVRIEREQDGEGWLVIARNHGWAHGDARAAIAAAREIANGYGVSVQSSAWRIAT